MVRSLVLLNAVTEGDERNRVFHTTNTMSPHPTTNSSVTSIGPKAIGTTINTGTRATRRIAVTQIRITDPFTEDQQLLLGYSERTLRSTVIHQAMSFPANERLRIVRPVSRLDTKPFSALANCGVRRRAPGGNAISEQSGDQR